MVVTRSVPTKAAQAHGWSMSMHEDERGRDESPADLEPRGRVLDEIRTPRAAAIAG